MIAGGFTTAAAAEATATSHTPGPAGNPDRVWSALHRKTPGATAPDITSSDWKDCYPGGPSATDDALATQLSPQINTQRMNGIDAGQVSCARAIVEATKAFGLNKRAAIIALTTATTESVLRDYIVYLDHDSLGLYQQRASQGWGTAAEEEDPAASTNMFLAAMENHYPNGTWNSGDIGTICQTVQISADPGAYDLEVSVAQLLADNLWSVDTAAKVTYAPGSNGSVQEAFTRGADGNAYEDFESSTGAWSGWHSLGGPVASDITYAAGSNGSVQEIFARNAGGAVVEQFEDSTGAWSGWHSLGGTIAGDVTYAPGSHGSVQELFARGTDGNAYEAFENSTGSWSGWHSLGGTVAGDITYAPGSNGSVQEIFARTAGGAVVEQYEDSTGNWSGWHSLGGTVASDVTYAPGSNGSVQELFARGTDGNAYQNWENSTGAWNGWHNLGAP